MNSLIAMQHQNQHPDISVFIKNLNEATDEVVLRKIFAKYGNVVSCKLAYDEKGKSKGYAFVQYENEEAAQIAIEQVNGMLVDDQNIYVGKFIPRKGRNKERDERNVYTNLYVKNFGNEFTEEQLRQLFEPFGKIKSHKIMTDIKGRSKGFGFVAYEKAEFAEEALQRLGGKKLSNGRKLYVARAQKKADRQQELQRQFEEQEERKRRETTHGINLYVKNLDDSVTHAHLRREFSQYGPLTSARVMTDSSGRSKGFGFVRFVSAVDACFAAAGLNGRMFGSKPLYVSLAQRKEERRALLVAQHMRQRLKATESYTVAKGLYRCPSIPTPPSPSPPPPPPPSSPSPSPQTPPSQSQSSLSQHQNCMHHQLSLSPQSSSCQVGKNSPSSPWSISPQRSQISETRNWRSSSLARQMGAVRSQCSLRYVQTTPSVHSCPTPSQIMPRTSPATSQQQLQAKIRPIPSAGRLSLKQYSSYTNFTGNELNSEKQIIGERLFFVVEKIYPQLAGKITGMILEMTNTELWYLLGNAEALRDKIEEAYQVYKAYLKEIRKGSGNLNAD